MSDNPYHIVLLGSGAVGKSCLTVRFVSNKFVEEYTPTLEDSYRKKINVDNEVCIVDIYDTAGEEDFQSVRTEYIKRGDGFLCVYSLTDQSSFDEIKDIYDEILRIKNNYRVPAVLVGNKYDLREDRRVEMSTGETFATDVMGSVLFETSAKTCRHVTDAFYSVVQRIRQQRAKQNILDNMHYHGDNALREEHHHHHHHHHHSRSKKARRPRGGCILL